MLAREGEWTSNKTWKSICCSIQHLLASLSQAPLSGVKGAHVGSFCNNIAQMNQQEQDRVNSIGYASCWGPSHAMKRMGSRLNRSTTSMSNFHHTQRKFSTTVSMHLACNYLLQTLVMRRDSESESIRNSLVSAAQP